jgi:hypothetical protein
MPILNVQTSSIGFSGVIPQFIYVNSNDVLSTVTSTGYLNNLFTQGYSFSQSDMALVTYIASSPPTTQTALFEITYSAGNWTLVQYPSGGGGNGWSLVGNSGTNPSTNFMGSVDDVDVVFKADFTEIIRMVASTGALQINDNATVGGMGGFPASVITGIAASGALLLTAMPLVSDFPQSAALVLGGSTNPELTNSAAVISPDGGTIFISNVMAGAFASLFPAGLLVGSGEPSSFGNATQGVVTLANQTTNPTTVGSGYGTIFSGNDSNLYYINNTATYQLTPPSGGGGGWNLTGTNTGAGHLLGTSSSDAWSAVAGSVPYITLNPSTTTLTLNSVNPGTITDINGNTINIICNTGGVIIDGIASSLATINIGVAQAGTIGIGNHSCTTMMEGNTITLSADNNINISNYGSGANVIIDSANFIQIGNTNAISVSIGKNGQVTGIQSADVYIPNLRGSIAGSVAVMWDPVTGNLNHA